MRLTYDTVGAPSRVLRVGAAVVVAVVVLLASVASAQERPITDRSLHWQPYVLLLAGQVADVKVTDWNIQRGCGEANVGVFGTRPSAWKLVKGKAPAVLVAAGLTAILQKTGHQKAANWTGGITGAVGFGAAGYNLTVRCGR